MSKIAVIGNITDRHETYLIYPDLFIQLPSTVKYVSGCLVCLSTALKLMNGALSQSDQQYLW